MIRLISLLALTVGVFGTPSVLGQDVVLGQPLFEKRYDPPDIGLEPQNWAVMQDRRGLVLVGNNRGLGLFDGQTWQTLSVPNHRVRAIAEDDAGRLFIGGLNEMGRLVPDSLGQLRYESLRYHLPEDDYGDIWNVLVTTDTVVFQGRNHLLFWDGHAFEVVQPDSPISRTYVVDNTLFVHLRDQPLKRWENGQLLEVAGTGVLGNTQLFALHQAPDNSYLLGTRSGEFYRLADGSMEVLPFQGNEYFETYRPYAFAALPTENGEVYAIGTFGGGIVVLDEEGQWLEHIALSEEDMVLDLAFDHQGGLWASLYNGLVRVDVLPSIRRYDSKHGLRGLATQVVRHRNGLYVSTALGVFRSLGAEPTWEPILTGYGQAWALGEVGSSFVAATNAGVFNVTEAVPSLVMTEPTYVLHEIEGHPGFGYAGLKDGLMLLQETGLGSVQPVGRVEGLAGEVFAIGQLGQVLWITLADGELLLLDLSAGLRTPVVQPISSDARPPGRFVFTEVGGSFAAICEAGVYRAERNRDGSFHLVPDAELNTALDLDETTYVLLKEIANVLWTVRGRDLLLLERTRTGYRRLQRPDLPLEDLHISHITADSGFVWLATEEGLLRYDPSAPKRYDAPYRPLFRRVTRGNSVLFGGTHGDGRIALEQSAAEQPVLAFSREELRVDVAAPSYNAPDRIVYQYRLDGFDADWSAWTSETTRSYTNLPERKRYVFRVRARNIHGVVSEEAQYQFRVLPPWYRSWSAYGLYGMVGAVLLWSITAFQVRAHRRELDIERMRRQRLDQMNQRLEASNQQLAEADQLKMHLLRNASHELRTPLTAMLGSAELLSIHLDGRDPDGAAFARTILAGSERLTRTVTDLMDVANLQADQFALKPADVDVADLVASVTDGLAPLALERGLYLRLSPEHIVVPAVLDLTAFRRIVEHVLMNAIKFTDRGGVALVLDADPDSILLRVTDTGCGFDTAELDRLKEAFTQASSGQDRSHEGSGLGLYIVTALMKRMLGSMRISSQQGQGTSVSLTWPRFDRRGATLTAEDRSVAAVSLHDDLSLLYVAGRTHYASEMHAHLNELGLTRVVRSRSAARRALRLYPYDVLVIQARSIADVIRMHDALEATAEHAMPPLLAVVSEGGHAYDDFNTSIDTVSSTVNETELRATLEQVLSRPRGVRVVS
ncbi:MAG: ATP-binding protein [Bacteroidota bacterium]